MGIAVRLTARQWLRVAGALAFLGMIGFVVMRSVWGRRARARSAQEGFLAVCGKEHAPETCEQKLSAHHEECFLAADHPGSKTSAAYLDTQAYEQCVMLGPEAWQAERLATKRARDAERKQLGLPP